MKDYQQVKFRPCTSKCVGICIFTFMGGFIYILAGITENIIPFVYIGIVFSILNVIVVIFSIKKWNSWMYIDNEKITQYQFGKEITIYYDDIDSVKVNRYHIAHAFPTIKICKNRNVITFDIYSGVRPFFTKCSNERVKNDLKILLKKNYILLPNSDFV